ncbi:MAG: tetratricopeptide repeat protein, partial [Saprospiraceae bacterium]
AISIIFFLSCKNEDCAGIAKVLFKENEANEKAYKEGNVDLAIQLASKVIESNPNNFIAYSNRAAFQYKKQFAINELSDEMKDSIYNDLYTAIDLCSEFEKAYENIIQISYELDEFKLIEKYGKLHHQIFKPNSQVLTKLGNALFRLGEFEEAIKYFDIATTTTPTDTSTYWMRGRTYRELGKIEFALKDLNRSIDLDSTSALAYHERAITFVKLKELDKAQDDYFKAINIDSTRTETYFSMGTLCMKASDSVLACLYYRKALKTLQTNDKIVPNIDEELIISTIKKYCD